MENGALVPGKRVVCPRCGKVGRVKVEAFKAGGRVYRYWVVVHSGHRHIICRYVEPEAGNSVDLIALLNSIRNAKSKYLVPPEGSEERQRAAYHAVKLVSSWGSFRESPTDGNYELLRGNIARIDELYKDRVKDITQNLLNAVILYRQVKEEKVKAYVNELLRNLVVRLTEEKGLEGVVTRNDKRRGKVYLPREWVGRKVKVIPLF